MALVDGWEPVAPMDSDGHSLASMQLEGWLKVLLCLFQHQQGHPMEEGIMGVDAMGVDATGQESMVSLILSRPTGQDGGSCQTRIKLLRIFHRISLRTLSVHLAHPALEGYQAATSFSRSWVNLSESRGPIIKWNCILTDSLTVYTHAVSSVAPIWFIDTVVMR